jgi:tetratricopeptide (TPR) repeat protein
MRLASVALLVLASASAAVRADEDPDLLIARGHFGRGKARYAAGDYAGALAEFEAAWVAKPVGDFKYNIARCNEQLGRPREALAAYQRWLTTELKPEAIAEGRQRIETLRAQLAAHPELAAPERRRPPAIVPALAVVSAVTAAAGAAVIGWVAADYSTLSGQCGPGTCTAAQVDQARGLETGAVASYALFAVAGVAAVTSIVVWAVSRRGGGAERATARLERADAF